MRQNTSLIRWISAGYLRISSGLGIFLPVDRKRIFAENLADGKWVLPLEFLSITPETGEKIQN